jgi:hypothetical protein
MTTFGKILVFMNLLFSVVTGALIVFVFTTRASWKSAYDDVARQATAAETAYKNERSAHDNDMKQRDAAEAGLKEQVRQLTNDLGIERQAVARALADLEAEKKKSTVDVVNSGVLQAEINQLKSERATLVTEKDSSRKKIVDLQKEVDDQRRLAVLFEVQAKTLVQKNGNLLRQVEDLVVKLREAESGGLGESIVNPSPKAAPPGVRGSVTHVGNSGSNLAQVSVGTDSGLTAGNVLVVYRENLYVGDLQIRNVEAKSAVGLFTPAKRDMKITVGDKVITSFTGVDNK